jgi:hypothetical protein
VPNGGSWGLPDCLEGARILEIGGSVRIDDWTSIPGPVAARHWEQRFGQCVAAPILIEDRIWGHIAAFGESDEVLPPASQTRLAEFTQLMAIANVRVRDQLRSLAERQGAALRRSRPWRHSRPARPPSSTRQDPAAPPTASAAGVAITAITAAKVAALIRMTVPAFVAARMTPCPPPGARFWFTAPSEIAWVRSVELTSSDCGVCEVGEASACPVPAANSSASRTHGVAIPATASAPSPAAARA